MPETLEGTVDRIRWSSPDTDWAVLGMMNGQDRFVAVGDLASVEPGEALELHGDWTHSKYGLQFKTETFHKVRPRSAQGIQKFLAGIPGVGFQTAMSLVNYWGDATLAKLEAGPEAALEVPGIGPHRAPAIYQAVRERTRRDDVLMELQSLSIGAALAAKILRWAGEDHAVARVKADPYRLRDLAGVAFKTADQIAGRLGIQCQDPRRIEAGIVDALEQASLKGHCCLPPDELVALASKSLKLTNDKVEGRVGRLVAKGYELQADGQGQSQRIYLRPLWNAEETLAARVRELLTTNAEAEPVPFDEDPDGVRLSDEQKAAVELALRSKFFILTGGPGTGKTTITRAIVRSFLARDLKLDLASPTGRAAQRLQEATGQAASNDSSPARVPPG